MIYVGINGLGRIGRNFLRAYLDDNDKNFIISKINDIADFKTLIHLVNVSKSKSPVNLSLSGNSVKYNDKSFKFTSNKIDNLKWENQEIVIESTGKYLSKKDVAPHFKNGAETVVITSPSNDADITLVPYINDKNYNKDIHKIISSASCTAQAVIPIFKAIEPVGVEKLFISTIHPYTVNNKLIDNPGRNLRESRSSTLSIIPSQTRADIAFTAIFPDINFEAFSFKIPTSKVACIDLAIKLKHKTTKDTINNLLTDFALKYPSLLKVTHEPLVSSDFECSHSSSVADLSLTSVIDDLIRVFAWYDNEWAYSLRLYELIKIIAGKN